MNHSLLLVILIAISAILLFFAVGYNGWGCGSSVLGTPCRTQQFYLVIGVLLIIAALLVFAAGVLLLIYMKLANKWLQISAIACLAVAAILSLAAVALYIDKTKTVCPYLASFGMILAVAIVVIMLLDITEE